MKISFVTYAVVVVFCFTLSIVAQKGNITSLSSQMFVLDTNFTEENKIVVSAAGNTYYAMYNRLKKSSGDSCYWLLKDIKSNDLHRAYMQYNRITERRYISDFQIVDDTLWVLNGQSILVFAYDGHDYYFSAEVNIYPYFNHFKVRASYISLWNDISQGRRSDTTFYMSAEYSHYKKSVINVIRYDLVSGNEYGYFQPRNTMVLFRDGYALSDIDRYAVRFYRNGSNIAYDSITFKDAMWASTLSEYLQNNQTKRKPQTMFPLLDSLRMHLSLIENIYVMSDSLVVIRWSGSDTNGVFKHFLDQWRCHKDGWMLEIAKLQCFPPISANGFRVTDLWLNAYTYSSDACIIHWAYLGGLDSESKRWNNIDEYRNEINAVASVKNPRIGLFFKCWEWR